jgi:hypothetical protein
VLSLLGILSPLGEHIAARSIRPLVLDDVALRVENQWRSIRRYAVELLLLGHEVDLGLRLHLVALHLSVDGRAHLALHLALHLSIRHYGLALTWNGRCKLERCLIHLDEIEVLHLAIGHLDVLLGLGIRVGRRRVVRASEVLSEGCILLNVGGHLICLLLIELLLLQPIGLARASGVALVI